MWAEVGPCRLAVGWLSGGQEKKGTSHGLRWVYCLALTHKFRSVMSVQKVQDVAIWLDRDSKVKHKTDETGRLRPCRNWSGQKVQWNWKRMTMDQLEIH